MCAKLMLVLVTGFLAPGPQEAKDKEALEGTWVVVSAEEGGKVNDDIKDDKLIFKGGTVTVKAKNKDTKGSYKLDPGKSPKELDFTEEGKNETIHAIYELKGDTLKICLAHKPGAQRPTKFDSKAEGHMVIELKREKK